MFVPDYDEYYSLESYASRFVSDPEEVVKVYLASKGALANLALSEKAEGNDLFRHEMLERIAGEGSEIGAKELIERTNSLLLYVENDQVFAHRRVYNDFVGFLFENNVVR